MIQGKEETSRTYVVCYGAKAMKNRNKVRFSKLSVAEEYFNEKEADGKWVDMFVEIEEKTVIKLS